MRSSAKGLAICFLYVLAICLLIQPTAAGVPLSREASKDPCSGQANDERGRWWFDCDAWTHDHSGGGPLGGQDGPYYVYLWLPACPAALPDRPGAEEMDCESAHNCSDERLLSLRLFSRLMSEAGKPLSLWRYVRTECRSKKSIGPGDPRHTLRWSDIRNAIRTLGVPRSDVLGPEFTLVNLRTTFFTHGATIDRTLRILGYVVDVHIEPMTFIWRWGDDTTTTTHTPGRPYPARDVTHTYAHSTTPDGPVALRVDVAYRARFRVDGGAWITVNDQLVVAGHTRYLPIKQASAVLVPPN